MHLKKASNKNLIIINEGMQFSAGVNLNYVMEFAKDKNWKAIEKFIYHFQMTCKQLKYSNNLVIAAPSGLALGGGFEVLVQSDYVVAHTNIVTGLVETIVGLIPAGGGTTNKCYGDGCKTRKSQRRIQTLHHKKYLILLGMEKQLAHQCRSHAIKIFIRKRSKVL